MAELTKRRIGVAISAFIVVVMAESFLNLADTRLESAVVIAGGTLALFSVREVLAAASSRHRRR